MTTEEIRFFDSIASDWDAKEVRSTPDRVNILLDIVGVESGWHVLDLGTGTGVLLPFLSERVGTTGFVEAVDISDGMLAEARRKYTGVLDNVIFRKYDFEKENIEGRFDLVMLYCVYPHLHDPQSTLRRLRDDNLTSGGRIIIGFPNDESFVNNVHSERKAPGDCLPSADVLAERLRLSGLNARTLAYGTDCYLVEITSQQLI